MYLPLLFLALFLSSTSASPQLAPPTPSQNCTAISPAQFSQGLRYCLPSLSFPPCTLCAPQTCPPSSPSSTPTSVTAGRPCAPVPSPALPSQTKKNCKGSALCVGYGRYCRKAVAKYEDDVVYRDYTSYIQGAAGYGCAAMFGELGCLFLCSRWGKAKLTWSGGRSV